MDRRSGGLGTRPENLPEGWNKGIVMTDGTKNLFSPLQTKGPRHPSRIFRPQTSGAEEDGCVGKGSRDS